MNSVADIREVFDQFFALIVRANELSHQRDEGDPLAVVKLRVDLSVSMMKMQRDVTEALKNISSGSDLASLTEEYWARIMVERRKISDHQVSWPAPAIKADRAGYERACQALYAFHEDNHVWRRDVLLPRFSRTISTKNMDDL
ncbi:MAG: hypothetical protein IBJ12_15475 [Sphingomonadaceae bacterium]|nr:hypothetical protein [Sphingomonadaceae bacterium]